MNIIIWLCGNFSSTFVLYLDLPSCWLLLADLCWTDLSQLPSYGYPFQVVLSQQSCPTCHVLAILSSRSCPGWPVQVYLSGRLLQTDLSRLSCHRCPVLAVLSWLSWHGCLVLVVLSQMSCPVFSIRPVVSVLSWLSCHSCPALTFLSNWPENERKKYPF